MRSRAFRRHQAVRHMRRRLNEDRNQHYDDLTGPCWYDPKTIAKFKGQPATCSCWMCSWQRATFGPTLQERRFLDEPAD